MARRIYYKNEELCLKCEWEECPEQFKLIDEFLHHISNHVKNISPENPSCLWCGCQYIPDEYDTDPMEQLLAHSFFHGFHSKIKCYGANMLKRDNIGECELDTSGRNIVPDLPTVLQCGWKDCLFTFNNPELFYRHVNNHVNQIKDTGIKPRHIKRSLVENEKYKIGHQLECQWQGCNNRKFTELEKLRNHLRSHSQEKLVACPTCGSLFSNRTKLFDHVKRQSIPTEGGFNCNSCEKSFMTERLLKAHLKNHVYRYSCTMCKFYAISAGNLESHVKYRHTSDRSFQCPVCSRTFKSSYNLKRHSEIHLETKHYKCSVSDCDYVTESYNGMVQHYKTSHYIGKSNGFQCHLCSKVYKRGHGLTKHLYSQHDFKPLTTNRLRYKLCEDGFYRLVQIQFNEGTNANFNENSTTVEKEMVTSGQCEPAEDNDIETVDTISSDGEKLLNGYQCHLCNEAYTRDHLLTIHLRSQHGLQLPAMNQIEYKLCEDGFYRLAAEQIEDIGSADLNEENVLKENESTLSHLHEPSNDVEMATSSDERNAINMNGNDTTNDAHSTNRLTATVDPTGANTNSNNSSDLCTLVVVPQTGSLPNQNVVLKVLQPDGSSLVYSVQLQGHPNPTEENNCVNESTDLQLS